MKWYMKNVNTFRSYFTQSNQPYDFRDYIKSLEQAWINEQIFVEFIAAQVLETEKDFMRMLHISFSENGVGEPSADILPATVDITGDC